MQKQVRELLLKMTTEEKIAFLSGQDDWQTKAFPSLGIPSIRMHDGPNGLRIEQPDDKNNSYPAVCYPAMSTLACSWDTDVFAALGAQLAQECRKEGVDILLGPGVNIKRSPLCGRNFEYLSEDPLLSGRLATAYISALQAGGVGASLKHFACNNQEYRRMVVNAIVSPRALHEIYLRSFEQPVREAKPYTVMSAYNSVGGVPMSDNIALLKSQLRGKWGFEGAVISDWGSVNDRAEGVRAGMNLEMPSSGGRFDEQVRKALSDGRLSAQELDDCTMPLLELVLKCAENRSLGFSNSFSPEQAHQTAQRLVGESMVLLKNSNSILPLRPDLNLGVVGASALQPRIQGGGSAYVNPALLENPLESLRTEFPLLRFAKGYHMEDGSDDPTLLDEAMSLAAACDVVLFFAALPPSSESEYYDRVSLELPPNQNHLIVKLAGRTRVIVVLSGGSAVTMPWLEQVDGLLEVYLAGEACGKPLCDLLLGRICPSGRLAETFPARLEDTPCYLDFPGDLNTLRYSEDIYVGYRYYDKRKVEPLFPFGFGLSYTSFSYGNLRLSTELLREGETLRIDVDITNTGDRAGKEVVQLYSSNQTGLLACPVRELRDFKKVALQPGECRTVSFILPATALSIFSENNNRWELLPGRYQIEVGPHSRQMECVAPITVESGYSRNLAVSQNTTLAELLENHAMRPAAEAAINAILTEKAALGISISGNYERLGQSRILTYPMRNFCDLMSPALAAQLEQFLMEQAQKAGVLKNKI